MNNFTDNVSGIVDDLDLKKPYDKAIIKFRFLDEISYYEKKRNETRKYYNTFRFIVTTGSILLPAVLSMGQMDPAKLPKNFDMITYWCSWTISLMVTGSNGFLQLFSLDKNYFSYSMVVEQLKTEGWQFFGLSGKYEDYPNHEAAYKTFSKSVESIKRKQIDQEFSNGKGENKKKKFDFKGEMQKFSDEQNANIKLTKITEKVPEIQHLVMDTVQDKIKDSIESKVTELKENISEQVEETTTSNVKEKAEIKKDENTTVPVDKKD
jgi:hypothetical protein